MCTSQVAAMEMIWTDHKCCNITVLTVQNILGVTAYFLHGVILSTSVAVCFSEGSLHTFHLFLLCIFERKYLYSVFQNHYPNFFFVHQKCHVSLSAVTISGTEIFGQVVGTAAWYSGGLGFKLCLWDQLSWWCFIASLPWDNSQGVTWNETLVTSPSFHYTQPTIWSALYKHH